ncbi:phospholipase A1-like [Adelges cooleyi]|uniref:phospholipase A1-like n=1 Tax=Adelges cooleyi TaxID=133065 RepID=UPI0021808E09|nr:phospholipase A1-like [Adelges cooleyi]
MATIVLRYFALLPLISIGSLAQYPACNPTQTNTSHLTFFLYTKNYSTIITDEDSSIKNAAFAESNDLVVYIIGYNTNYTGVDCVALRQTYLNRTEDNNIIVVDYSNVTGPVDPTAILFLTTYMKAARCDVPQVAKKVVDLIISIHKNRPEINSTHVIGASLGGQIAGRVGSLYKEKKGTLLNRVTVLDAAGMFYQDHTNHVTPECATIVDAYHTNSGFLAQITPIGTVDFYINNAFVQPVCIYNQTELEDVLHGYTATFVYFCSHNSAFIYYIASINYDQIYAKRCNAIKSLTKDSNNVYILDDNNKNALMRTCEEEVESEDSRIVFGEHLTPGVTGVFYASIENLLSLIQYINI